jgi:hypothetical protein
MVDIKQAAKMAQNGSTDKPQGHRHNRRICHQNAEKKKDPEAIPMLHYGPSNNFMKFMEALLNKALLDFLNLGKMIKQGYIILPDQPDRETYGLDDDLDELNKIDYLKDMKAYRHEIVDFRRD